MRWSVYLYWVLVLGGEATEPELSYDHNFPEKYKFLICIQHLKGMIVNIDMCEFNYGHHEQNRLARFIKVIHAFDGI